MPKLLAPWTSFIASATRSTAFAGMHASFRQRPPTVSAFSTTAVFMPELGGADRGHVATGSRSR